jgi:hypothetical protein
VVASCKSIDRFYRRGFVTGEFPVRRRKGQRRISCAAAFDLSFDLPSGKPFAFDLMPRGIETPIEDRITVYLLLVSASSFDFWRLFNTTSEKSLGKRA